MKFIEINPEEFKESPFKIIGKDWMLVASQDAGKINAMTASWGGFGVMWAKNVAYVVLRPQRYTKEMIDISGEFSLSFFDEKFKKQLGYFGTVSGRDEDKIQKSGMATAEQDNIPYFKDANIVILCKNLYSQAMKPECFIDKEQDKKWYPEKDYHVMYIAEVKSVLVKK